MERTQGHVALGHGNGKGDVTGSEGEGDLLKDSEHGRAAAQRRQIKAEEVI